MNIVMALQKANAETMQFLCELEKTAELLGYESVEADPGLRISKAAAEGQIAATEAAIASGDTVAMVNLATALGIGEADGTDPK